MIDQGGKIFLTDFGIARHAESTTTTLGTAGTPAYMAPEQIRVEKLTPATDVYALGVLIFEMETGQRPFRGDESGTVGEDSTVSERIRYAHQFLTPPDIRQFNPTIPEAHAKAVMKAMAKLPKERYASAQELFLAACSTVGTNPSQIPDRIKSDFEKPPPPTPPPDIIDQTGPRFSGIRLALILGGILLAIIIAFFTFKPPLPPPPALAQTSPNMIPNTEQPVEITSTNPLILATPMPTDPNWQTPASTSDTDLPTSTTPIDPSKPQGKIAFTCQYFLDDTRDQICVINLEDLIQHRLTKNDYADHGYPSISPDGQTIVLSSNLNGNFDIFEMDLLGNLSQLTNNLGKLYAPEISPDGKWIAFTNTHDGKQTLWVMNRDGNNPREIYAPAAGDLVDPTWSLDSEKILFAMGTDVENKQLYTIDRNGGDLHPVSITVNGIRGRSDWSPDGSLIATYVRTNPSDRWSREIFLIGINGSPISQITHGGQNLAPSFSPDGQWITFMSYRDNFKDFNGCEIYVMRLDDGEIRRLTNNNYCDYQPRWGP